MDSSAATDPFFLDWGSSVNVNEDLRRTIRAEIEGIDSDIQKLQSNVKAEEKICNQLTKDFCYARNELMNLGRGATDDRDNSTMNEQIQMRLHDSLMTEIVSVITPPTTPDEKSSISPSDDIIPNMKKDDYSNERHLGKYLTKCSSEVKTLSTSIQKKKADYEDCESKLTSVQLDINNILNQIDRDQKTQDSWSDDVHEKTREFDSEKQRIQRVKDSIKRARNLNAHHAQRLANDVSIIDSILILLYHAILTFLYDLQYQSKELSERRADNTKTESNIDAKKKSLEDSLSHTSKKYAALVEKHSQLSNHIENFTTQLKKRKVLVSKRAHVKELCDEKRNVVENLRKKESDMKISLSDARKTLQAKETKFEEYTILQNDVSNLKAKNNIDEESTLIPAKERYPELLKEKETLAKVITDLYDTSNSTKEEIDLKRNDHKKILNDLDSTYKEKVVHLESLMSDIEKTKKLIDETIHSARKEAEETNKLAENLNEAIKAQSVINNEKKDQLDKVKREKLELTNKFKQKTYELRLMKLGADIILKTRQVEDEINRS